MNDSEQYEFEGGEKESGPIKPINAPKAPKKPKHQDETTFPDLPSINDEVGCTNGWLKDPQEQRGVSESQMKRSLNKFEQVEQFFKIMIDDNDKVLQASEARSRNFLKN